MFINYKPHSITSQQSASRFSRERVKNIISMALEMSTDHKKKERRLKMECSACFYASSRIGGAAMTTWYCGICALEQSASSTNTDRVCSNCARSYELCVHCGGDAEMRENRKLNWPTPVSNKDD